MRRAFSFDRKRVWSSKTRICYTTVNEKWFFSGLLTVTLAGDYQVTLDVFKKNDEGDFVFESLIINSDGHGYINLVFAGSAPHYVLYACDKLERILLDKYEKK